MYNKRWKMTAEFRRMLRSGEGVFRFSKKPSWSYSAVDMCGTHFLASVWAPAVAALTSRWRRRPPGWTCSAWWRPDGSRTPWLSQWTPWPPRPTPLGRLGLRSRTGQGGCLHPAPTRNSQPTAHTEGVLGCHHWVGEMRQQRTVGRVSTEV